MNNEAEMLLIQLYYLPTISIFSLLKDSNEIYLVSGENYQKQTFRNRTNILTSNGILTLTIPVKHGPKLISEVKIDYDQTWVKNHLKSIETSYKHSPFFEFYYPYFDEIYNKRLSLLYTLNYEIFVLCLKILKLNPEVKLELNQYLETPNTHKFILKGEYSGSRNCTPYRQVFGTSFIPDLSILDLIFNMGPESKLYL